MNPDANALHLRLGGPAIDALPQLGLSFDADGKSVPVGPAPDSCGSDDASSGEDVVADAVRLVYPGRHRSFIPIVQNLTN